MPVSPLNNGWAKAKYSIEMDPNPEFSPLIVGSEVRLNMRVANVFAMEHEIAISAQLSRRVQFSAIYHKNTMLYLGFKLRKEGRSVGQDHWIKIEHGKARNPEINKGWPTEYVVWVEGEGEPDGWTFFDLPIGELIGRTWQKHGYEFEAITKLRLRGSLCISPIRLCS
ncbi:MAG TPA: hypothetical protein VMF91_06485 [Bryobacteraceae bacterium]|nr:hypothetical protein [Bryobacteraceae bacterium]